MANSTTNLVTLTAAQAGKETTANQLFDAASPATAFGRIASLSSGLRWHYYGGTVSVNGTPTQIANGFVDLTGGTVTNYIERSTAGAVSFNTTGFTAGRTSLYSVSVVSGIITGWTDYRSTEIPVPDGRATITVTTSDVTLTAIQARCRILEVSGSKNAARALIVPTQVGWYIIVNYGISGGGGPFPLTIKTSAGTGIAITDAVASVAKTMIVACDGTNVIRITAEGVSTP